MANPEDAAQRDLVVVPVNAPLPAGHPGRNATDPQGVRLIDSEDPKSHGLDNAIKKKKSKTAPLAITTASSESSTPVNDMRRISASLSRQIVRHSYPNLFIPAFGMLFRILDVMNNKVCSLRDYSDRGSANDWIPQVSTIVYSVLAIVQTLRAQIYSGYITSDQADFLQKFLSIFDLSQIVIPGPLVPIFRSISVSNPGFSNFQNVFPAIPSLTFREESFFNMDYRPDGVTFPGIALMLPHIPLMLDQFIYMITWITESTTQAPHRYSAYDQLSTIFGATRPATAGESRNNFDRLKTSVGFWHRPTVSDEMMARFASHIVCFPTSFQAPWKYDGEHAAVAADPTATPPTEAREAAFVTKSSFLEYMCMDVSPNWFSLFLRCMHNFNPHWHGNVTMNHIHPTSSTAGMIRFRGVQYSAIHATSVFQSTPHNAASHELVYNTSAHTACPHIVNEDFEDAQVAQLNIECEHAFGTTHIGDLNVTRFGDFWQVSPDYETTAQADLTQDFQSMAVSPIFFKQ